VKIEMTGEDKSELEETPRESCGVFGVYAPGEDVARLTFFGLFALQHRGQESAGIAVSDGKQIRLHRAMGLAFQVFDEEILGDMKGDLALGHVRYSTTGSSRIENAHPIIVLNAHRSIVLGHNGNLITSVELRCALEERGIKFHGTTDSEIIANLIAESQERKIEDAVVEAMKKMQGAYSLVIMTEKELVGVRDPYGVRPLCLGQLNGDHYVIASETCALNLVGAKFIREIEPGEIVVIDSKGLREIQGLRCLRRAMCIFEFIYFARPDSNIYGKSLYMTRRRMGNVLVQEHPVEADLVIPVPDTGWSAATGFSEASKIPFGEGLIRNRYIHRTFIQPDQRMRELGVKMKLTPLREALSGKRVVVVEDSIVRGTTMRGIVGLLRDGGAKEVHVRISSPPYRYSCFYGIDTQERCEILAATRTVEEIRQFIGADTLGYLSLKGLVKAVGLPKNKFCMACFDNHYPIPILRKIKPSKLALEEKQYAGVKR